MALCAFRVGSGRIAFPQMGTDNPSIEIPIRNLRDERRGVLAIWQQRVLELRERSSARRPFSARMEEIPEWRLFWAEDPPLADPFLRELIASRPMQRLRHVGFLGAIDYLVHGNGRAPHRRRHNRFDHSVNVALLALRYAVLRDLGEEETRVLTAAALLHDVGHGPLSHTLEPAFQKLFDIDHHEASRAIVRGTSPLGRSIPQIFASHGVDLDEVIELLGGRHGGPHAFLFDSPMNFDTIEAIARCCLFSRRPEPVMPTEFVDAIATQDDFPVELGDRFWSIKATIYRTVILSRSGLLADAFAQQYMLQMAAALRAEDFYLDDTQLRKKLPELFLLFGHIRERSFHAGRHPAFSFNFDSEIEALARRFTVDTEALVNSPGDLAVRYTQQKRKCRFQLRSLVLQGLHKQQLVGDGELELR